MEPRTSYLENEFPGNGIQYICIMQPSAQFYYLTVGRCYSEEGPTFC